MNIWIASGCFALLAWGLGGCNDTSSPPEGASRAADGPNFAAPAPSAPVSIEAQTSAPPSRSGTAPVVTPEQIEAEHSPDLSRCMSSGAAAKGVSVAMGGCVDAELQAQDARLNITYQAALARLDAAGKAGLRREQRAWIRHRDAICVENLTGGTGDMVEFPSCLLDETVGRRLVLEATAG